MKYQINKTYLTFLLLITNLNLASANLPTDPQEYKVWQTELLDAVRVDGSLPPDESIPKLGMRLRQLSSGMNIEQGERPVFKSAQATLLAIPGRAIYFKDKIEGMRAEALVNYNLSREALQEKRKTSASSGK